MSSVPLLADIVESDQIEFDPGKNQFPVTLHDPCNLVRLSGIVEPQRRILNHLCPQFREMEPHGVDNYCCGGGSGLSAINSRNFPDWRGSVSGRTKFKQILEAFSNSIEPETCKFLCVPCAGCKAQFRGLLNYYNAWRDYSILYGGLAEVIANAMVDTREPFIKWERR